MKRMRRATCLAAGLCIVAAAASAQPAPDRGQREYEGSCAVCHGADARGGGPLRPYLIVAPSDLTTLARRHGGTFPTRFVMEVIDGRSMPRIGAHGPREMPVWGQVFLEEAQGDPAQAKLHPEWSVRARIVALIDYLGRLQVK